MSKIDAANALWTILGITLFALWLGVELYTFGNTESKIAKVVHVMNVIGISVFVVGLIGFIAYCTYVLVAG